jgi:hypothetical protein
MEPSRARRYAPLAILAVATAVLAKKAIGGVLGKVGHPAAALDDAYIHFAYARAFAEGHPFRYYPGAPISTGATSLLWPLVLAPFHLVGFRGDSLMWPAWVLSFLALGALAYEAYRLTEPLTGRAAAAGASAMVLGFGGFAWCAASGMEVIPFAWSIAFVSRRTAEWVEAEDHERTRKRMRPLLVVAILAPLLRPEGSLTAFVVALVIALDPPTDAKTSLRGRAWSAAFVAAALGPTFVLLALTGKTQSSTAEVKLLFGNPYHPLAETALSNARTLFGSILDGDYWSAEFVPKGGAIIALLGLVSLGWRGFVTHRYVRAALVLLLALSMLVPCFYVTFLWNRLRYLWPFATGWFIALACLARALGDLGARLRLGSARFVFTTSALVSGIFAGMLATKLEWVLEDVAQSASGIDRQQAALGRWANESLPRDARIGVNDTGAIAYFGRRATFDVVGLTTPGEGRYWVGGSASRLEHYERMRATTPNALPTHFIVYPEWMGCEPLLGKRLHEAVVTDATILGGTTMRVYEARWDFLGTGEAPWTKVRQIHDTLDVADLESEAQHRYELLGAKDGEQSTVEDNAPAGGVVLDGGRTNRTRDRFVADVSAPGPLAIVARIDPGAPMTLRLLVEGAEVATASVEAGPWTEVVLAIPESARGPQKRIEVNAPEGTFTSFHYWIATP